MIGRERTNENSPRLQRCAGAGFCLPAALFVLTATSTPVAAQNFVVEYVDEKLSIQANNSRVKELLLEIQDKTGIEVNFIADPKDTVSLDISCLLYTSPSPRDKRQSRMPSSA